MILFSEKVEPTFTSSNLNILTVKDFQEIFYDVFEFEINGKKFIAEKISEYKGSPVVDIPLVMDGKEFTAPFVLQTGEFEILFNRDNTTFVRECVDIHDEVVVENVGEESEIEKIILEKREDILTEVTHARRSAKEYAEQVKQQKITEVENYFKEKKRIVKAELEESKKGLLDEFLALVESTKSEFYDFNILEREKLSSLVELKVSELTEQLAASIELKQGRVEKVLSEKINELATDILSNILLKEIKNNSDKVSKRIDEEFELAFFGIKELIDENNKEVEKRIKSEVDGFSNSILNLEKLNIELSDQINKGDNRALSRIGNIKSQLEEVINTTNTTINNRLEITEEKVRAIQDTNTQLETTIVENEASLIAHVDEIVNSTKASINGKLEVTEEKIKFLQDANTQLGVSIAGNESTLIARIDEAESRIREFYDGKIDLINERVTDITEENKQYVLSLINESKQSLLNEISNIKVEVPNIVIEKSNGKQDVDLKGIKSELEKIIGTRFSNELQSLKRLIEMSSGGGSVAKQFANGGIMDGNLTVNGVISASEYKGIDLSNYLPISGGTITDSLNILYNLSAERIYTTQLDVLSANINVIDIKQYELSGFNVTGSATVMGSVSASDRIYSNIGINAPHIRLQTGSFYGQINAPAVPTQDISVNLPNSSGTIATNNTAVMLVGTQTVGGAKTFTGQVELTNQQAISGSSALTRQLGDDRYGTRYDILSADISSTSANFINVVSITLPVGLYQIDAFLASLHTTNVGSKIRFSTSQNIKVGLTDNYSRPTVAAISWPVVDGAYNNSHPYAIRTEVAGTEFRRTITGIIEVLINGTTIGLDYAQSVSTPLSPSTARARSHILARRIN